MAKKSGAPKGPKAKPSSAVDDRKAKISAAGGGSGAGRGNAIVIASVVVVVAIIAIVAGTVIASQRSQDKIAQGGNAVPAGASVEEGYRAYADVTVKDGAPVVDLFEDFQCPACKGFEDRVGSTIEEAAQAGDIELRYHVVNFLDEKLGNDSSTRAGTAAFCAADAGKFIEYHNQIYVNQPAREGDGYTDEQFETFATASGLSGDALDTWKGCFNADKYASYVSKVDENAFKNGLRGTPTVRFNGKDVETNEIATPETLKAYIKNATK